MKKVLMIAYIFPPMGGGGAIRTVKFAKYLPLFGWKPIVLTVMQGEAEYLDWDFYQEIRDRVSVYKTRTIDLPLIYNQIRSNITENQQTRILGGRIDAVLDIFKSFVNRWCLIPDSRIGWLPFAVLKGLRVIEKRSIDCIYSTGGPWTDHLIGFFLKTYTGKPWVSDFRDFWTQDPNLRSMPTVRQRIEKYMERKVIECADRVISVNKAIGDYFLQTYHVDEKKLVTISNGYDQEDLANLSKGKENKSLFHIVYTGSVNAHRTPVYLLRALRQAINHYPDLKQKIRVSFIGTADEISLKEVEMLELGENVMFLGCRSHKEAISYLFKANMLLLLSYTGEYAEVNANVHLTGKIFEYLATGIPIFALAKRQSAIAKIVQQTRSGVVIEPENVKQIENALYDCYLKWHKGYLSIDPDWSLIRTFDRKELTRKLAATMDGLL
nr:glycosyltransferase [Desulfobacterales bacterium]